MIPKERNVFLKHGASLVRRRLAGHRKSSQLCERKQQGGFLGAVSRAQGGGGRHRGFCCQGHREPAWEDPPFGVPGTSSEEPGRGMGGRVGSSCQAREGQTDPIG